MIRYMVRMTVVVGALALVWCASAGAGRYHVYSCRTPAGAVAPTDGWTGSVAPGGAYDQYKLDTCEHGGALIAALGDVTVHKVELDAASWTFNAPVGEAVVDATLWRAGDTDGGNVVNATYEYWLAGLNEFAPFDSCIYALGCQSEGDLTQPLSSFNRVVAPTRDLGTYVSATVYCGGAPGNECRSGIGDANNYAAAIYLYAADITLTQPTGPTTNGVTGELATAPTIRGASDVAFNATDPAAGVYEALFTVDNQLVQSTVVDDNGGHCRDVGGASDGLPAFLYTQPCAQTVSVDVPFDTTHISDGAHHLVVSVIDAAGNSAPVLDRQVTIANPPSAGAPNGTNASLQASLVAGWVGSSRARIASAYGRVHAIAGRLAAPGGAPIVDARIDCTVTPAYQGAKAVAMACPRTDVAGRFVVRLPREASSRQIRIAYRTHVADALPAATRTLVLGVKAGIGLRVSPHTTSVGRTIRFAGVLRGGPIPRGGKQVVLEARSPGGSWIEFDVARTDRRGRFRDSYRFKFPGPVDYRFRAVSQAEADYPYAMGDSNVVRAHER
jgi:hypothetical protein